MPAYTYQQKSYAYGTGPLATQYPATTTGSTPTLTSPITTQTLGGGQGLVNLGTPPITTPPLITNDTQASTTEDPNKFIKDYLATQTPPPSGAEAYRGAYGVDTPEQIAQKEAAVKVSTDKINALNSQIQGIINSATQANLTLESQAGGKDVTGTFLGRQQQEINRQSAIQVLPLQTQVLTEQAALTGNAALLEQAQGKIDTYFKYLIADEKNAYDYKEKLIDKFYQYAEKREQTQLDKAKTERAQAFQLANANRSDQNSWASKAAGNGQGALASQIMSLDATAPDFQTKLAQLTGQIKIAQKITIPDATVIEGSTTDEYGNVLTPAETKAKNILDQIDTVQKSPAFSAGVGFSFQKLIPFGQKLGLIPGLVSFNAEVDRLKALLSVDTMKLFKGQGALSDKERELITSIGTSLNTGMTEKAFTAELNRLKNLFNKAYTPAQIQTEGSGQTSSGIKFQVIK